MDVESVIALMLGLQLMGACIAAMGQKTRMPRKIAEWSAYPTALCLIAAIIIFIVGMNSSDSSTASIYIPIYLVFLAGAGLLASALFFILLSIITGIYKSVKPQNRS